MTLEEAMAAKKLMLLTPFCGWSKCGKLTGRYIYDTIAGREDPKFLKVEIRSWIFFTKWVYLSNLQAVKEVSR